MRLSSVTAVPLFGLVTASPLAVPPENIDFSLLSKRATGITSNEFRQGGCRDVIFAFARGSTEVGNMGSTVGPPTSDGLKQAFGEQKVATDGVNYPAGLATNTLPGGADPIGINDLKDILTKANAQCPNSVLAVAGYSQGAAVAHRAIENLPQAIKDQIAGVVTYGDTQKQQDNDQIPNFPKDKLKIICNPGDLVCVGTLTILPPHLDYVKHVPEAVSFLTDKIKGAMAKRAEGMIGNSTGGA